jgi:hypothetical protein
VPTAAERAGDFNPFAGLLLDPLANNTPFPGGIIPASRLPSPMAWRIATNLTPSNDSTRLSDMNALQSAIALTQSGSKPASMGSANTVYVSIPDPQATTASGSNCASLSLPVLPAGYAYHCSGPSYYQKTDGTGWIPINFSSVTSGSPLGTLLVDPTNTASSRLYYTYTTNGSQYETTAVMESPEYKMGGTNDVISQDGGTLATVCEKGTKLGLEPLDYGDASLVAYWTFDEGAGTAAYDYSGHGDSGAIYSGNWGSGKVGSGGISFPGINSANTNYVSVSPVASSLMSALTVSAWVNSSVSLAATGIYSLLESDSSPYVSFRISGSRLAFRIDSWGGSGSLFYPLPNGYQNQWVLFSGTWDSSAQTIKLYVNGQLVATNSGVTSPAQVLGWPTAIAQYTVGWGSALNGLIDDVRIYSRAVSTSEIQAMYNGGK